MLAERADFIGESDFHGVVKIGNVLHHFGDADGSFKRCRWKTSVEFAHGREVLRILRSENGVGRLQEVANGAAFAHELRVVADGEIHAATFAAGLLDGGNHQSFGRPWKDRAAQHDRVERRFLFQSGADFSGNMLDVA